MSTALLNSNSTYIEWERDRKSEFCCIPIVNKIGNQARKVANYIADKALRVFKTLGQIRSDGSNFGRSLRLCNFVFMGIEHYLGRPKLFSAFSERFAQTDSFIDTVNVLESIWYFVGGRYKNDNLASTLGWAAFTVAGGLGIFLFLDELAIIDLASIGAKMGNSIFGKLTEIGWSLNDLALGAVGAAYTCFGVSAFIRLMHAETPRDTTQAWLDLAWSIAEVALKIFIFSGCSSVVSLVVLGSIAAVLGLVAFVYERIGEEKAPQNVVKPQLSV
jgi:hypothetical protein